MRVEYTLEPKQEATTKETIVSPYLCKMDDAEVSIEINECKIDKLKISFCDIGYDLSLDGPKNRIILHNREQLRYSAYNICSYISNRIFVESGTDVFDCRELIDSNAPEIYPETQKEKEDMARATIFKLQVFGIKSSITNIVDLQKFDNGYQYEKAYTAYADGLRSNSIFTQYVQYYKAIEAIVGDKKIDDKVSDITEPMNPKFNKSRFEELRRLRNRCEHPRQSKGHLSSNNIQHIKEIEKNLPDLTQILKILFKNYGKDLS